MISRKGLNIISFFVGVATPTVLIAYYRKYPCGKSPIRKLGFRNYSNQFSAFPRGKRLLRCVDTHLTVLTIHEVLPYSIQKPLSGLHFNSYHAVYVVDKFALFKL